MARPPYILGLSAFYHDSAAALIGGGEILAAAQQERFSRKKNDERFPTDAVAYCLRQTGITPADLAAVVFYDKPIIKFTRLLESYLAVAPFGWRTFGQILPSWLSEKLDLRGTIQREISGLAPACEFLFTTHHQAHAASAFYPSPFREAAILTVDGVGEWATTVIAHGRDDHIESLQELRFPHSLGLLYSAFTAYCGFRINSGEYKLMGLAPYGEPRYVEKIRSELLDLRDDGSFRLNLDYFDFLREGRMTNAKFNQLFEGPPRPPEAPLTPRHCDVARSIQVVTEEVMVRLARHARALTGSPRLCLAGGVALNCVANGRLLAEEIFDDIWIQPAAGDSGGALGAALSAWHDRFAVQQPPLRPARVPASDGMRGSLLGPEYSDAEIRQALDARGAVYQRLDDDALLDAAVAILQAEKIVGWFQGRMEFGPRALGNRSILGDPRSPRMQSVMNLKVKFRESFRPFAPAVLRERAGEYFALPVESPYMLLVAPVQPDLRRALPSGRTGLEWLQNPAPAAAIKHLDLSAQVQTVAAEPNPRFHALLARFAAATGAPLLAPRSTVPAVTHIDYSARVQTVAAEPNPRFHALLTRFAAATGCPMLVNTSFNVRGEPIVCTPDDAYRCFVNTYMDHLVVGNYLLERAAQPLANRPPRPEYEPD